MLLIATATPNLRQYAASGLPTILRPVLRIDRVFVAPDLNNNTPAYFVCGQHTWITKSFQGVTGDVDADPSYLHYPR